MIGVELERPFPLGFGVLHQLPRIIYTIEVDNDGDLIKGFGEASIDFPFSHYDAYDVYSALQNLELEGQSIQNREKILNSSAIREDLLINTPAAFCALNMALDDALGRSVGKSVIDIYGGKKRSGLRALSSLSFKENDMDLVNEASILFQGGFIPKVKLGRGVERDLITLSILDKNTPDEFRFAVDFNAQYSDGDSEEFLHFLSLSKFDYKKVIFWEQPTISEGGVGLLLDFKKGLSTLDSDVIVIADESFVNYNDALKCALNNIGLNYKIHKVGGIYIAKEIEGKLKEKNLLGEISMVGGTFPTAIGRTYDRQAACVLESTNLPSDGVEPSTDWFKGEKHFIKEDFPQKTKEDLFSPHEGSGLGVNVEEGKIRRFRINDPEKEYRQIRTDQSGDQLKIELKEGEKYSKVYRSLTDKDSLWNLK